LRGVMHAVMVPISLVAGIVLVVSAPTTSARVSSAIFATTAVLLFTVSTLLHRGTWSERTEDILRRLDHANIYLIIAGTYPPFGVLALPPDGGKLLLAIVWTGAIAGVFMQVFWLGGPRWLSTSLYVVVGWVAVFFIPGLIDGAGLAAVLLIATGGILYTLGAVVYAIKRPNPSPRVFGFHEVFHTFTVLAFASQYVAVWLVVHQ